MFKGCLVCFKPLEERPEENRPSLFLPGCSPYSVNCTALRGIYLLSGPSEKAGYLFVGDGAISIEPVAGWEIDRDFTAHAGNHYIYIPHLGVKAIYLVSVEETAPGCFQVTGTW